MPREAFEKLMTECRETIAAQDRKAVTQPPSALCHLTDVAGFTGIVSSRHLWACLVTESNDASEIRYGRELTIGVLEERLHATSKPLDARILLFLRDGSKAPTRLRYELAPLAISFCGTCETSSQWLHYGRSGRGVALVFSPALAQATGLDFAKVEYRPGDQRARIEQLLDVGETAAASPSADIDEAAQVVVLWLHWLWLRLKHPSFENEAEWRLCEQVVIQNDAIVDGSVLNFRQTNDRVVPYELHSFPPELLREAVVGYSSPLSPEAARLLILGHGFTAGTSRSTVPVR